MKVVYKKPITEQILELKYQADSQNKQIDYIEVTKQEALQIFYDTRDMLIAPWGVVYAFKDEEKIHQINGSTIYGIKIKVNHVKGRYET